MRRAVPRSLVLALSVVCSTGVLAQDKRAILSLLSGEPGLVWTDQMTSGFVDVIDRAHDSPTLYFEYFDAVRFEDPLYAEHFREWLRFKYRDRRIDVVVARGQESVELLAGEGSALWPGVPVLYTDLSGLPAKLIASLPGAVGVIIEDHTPAELEVMKALLPGTERVALVYGASATEKARYSGFPSRVTAAGLEPVDLGGLAMADLLEKVARLPERTTILYFPIQVDATGRTFPTNVACKLVSDAANRPMFSLYRMDLGFGIVGGRLTDFSIWGEVLGERALEALEQPSLRTMVVPVERHARLEFDARQLARWGIDEDRLPPGSAVEFRAHSLWRDYRPQVLAALAVGLLQAFLIAGLLLEHGRRRRAELAERRHLATIAHVDRRGAMGELAASLAHELGQPLAAILANAKAAELMLAAGPIETEELRNILEDIRGDDLRAAAIIRGMREMLQKRELRSGAVDLNQLVRETAALVTPDARIRQIDFELQLAPGLATAAGEPIYLQQVLLNLMLNGVAAVAAQPPELRRVRVQTLSNDGLLELVVSDTGHGIPQDLVETIFEPFVTTKEHGLGVGLSIARSIVEAHGGRIEAANNPGGGASFRVRLPIPKHG
jgi:signal transduction histidine kinase